MTRCSYVTYALLLYHCSLYPLALYELGVLPTQQAVTTCLLNHGGSQEETGEAQATMMRILDGSYHVESVPTQSHVDAHTKSTLKRIGLTAAALLPCKGQADTIIHCARALKNAYRTAHSERSQSSTADAVIQSSALLRAAHECAVHCVVKLLVLLISPHAHPFTRMCALFVLNRVYLLGTYEQARVRCIERMNSFYFDQTGTLLHYDPSSQSATTDLHLRQLIKFFKRISPTRSNYQTHLTYAIKQGIARCVPYCEQSSTWFPERIKQRWHYLANAIKATTSIDIMSMRTVPSERIWAHAGNQELYTLMKGCLTRKQIAPIPSTPTTPYSGYMHQLYKDWHIHYTTVDTPS